MPRQCLIAFATLRTTVAAALAAGAFAAAPAQAAPSSAQLAYVTSSSGGTVMTVWVANAKGQNPSPVAQGDQPVLSPNGKLVAMTSVSSNSQGVLVYSVSGSLVASFPGAQMAYTFSPDSRYLTMQKGGLQVADLQAGSVTQIAKGNLQGASFAPGRNRLVYGLSASQRLSSPVNLYTVNPNGSNRKQLTKDGRSANPVWGKLGIAFDRVTLRGASAAPISQIYVLSGGRARQITNLKIPSLLSGLVPLAIASDGVHMVAAYTGEDTDEAWTVNLKTKALKWLKAGKKYVTPWGISRNGKRVLVALGGFQGPPTGDVATIPFSGGKATVLVKRAGHPELEPVVSGLAASGRPPDRRTPKRTRRSPPAPGRRRCTSSRGRSGRRGAAVLAAAWQGSGHRWHPRDDRARSPIR